MFLVARRLVSFLVALEAVEVLKSYSWNVTLSKGDFIFGFVPASYKKGRFQRLWQVWGHWRFYIYLTIILRGQYQMKRIKNGVLSEYQIMDSI